MRRGMGFGRGRGYRNIIGKDPLIHAQSARGQKQPQVLLRSYGLRQRKLGTKQVLKIKSGKSDVSPSLEQAFDSFISHSHKHRVNRYVTRIGTRAGYVFVKERYNEAVARRDVEAHNILAAEYEWQPQAIYKEHGGKHYAVVMGVGGYENMRPIQYLDATQKENLARMTNTLYQHGIVNYDLRNDNIKIDDNRNPVIIDLDQAERVDNAKAREMQYNINLVSIFGIRNLKAAEPYMTMTLKQIGYE